VSLHTWSALAGLFKETKNGEKKRKSEKMKLIIIMRWLQKYSKMASAAKYRFGKSRAENYRSKMFRDFLHVKISITGL
jgi:hypothetical protein